MYLRLENITKRYETKLAVDNLSLQVPQGAIYGIIGPNGAGKTTTIRMIMNIIAPDSGTILFDGKKIDDSFRDRAGYLPEERGLYKKMTLNEIVLYLAELKNCRRSQIVSQIGPWLERMGLAEYRYRKVEELSKGMAQKLQFITTIIHNPDIVILDELFSGLDPVNIELIKNILLELKRDGKTILFSTHVMEQAEKLCDYICMINAGEKVIDGRMAEVKAQFGKNTVQVEIQGDGAFIGALPEVKRMAEFGNYLELTLREGAEMDNLLRAMIGKVKVRRFEMMEPSLYQIFIETAKVDPSKHSVGEGSSRV
jgi:ABC-2 type transport system ATP-binding protein